jgi:hypothetical protein
MELVCRYEQRNKDKLIFKIISNMETAVIRYVTVLHIAVKRFLL